jgi:hypothetical protein
VRHFIDETAGNYMLDHPISDVLRQTELDLTQFIQDSLLPTLDNEEEVKQQ